MKIFINHTKVVVRLSTFKANEVQRGIKLPSENESFFVQNYAQGLRSSKHDRSLQTVNNSHDWLVYFLDC